MNDAAQKLAAQLAAQCKRATDRPLGSTKEQTSELVSRYGTVTKAAQALGVSRSTVRRWTAGTTPSKPAARDKLTSLVRAARAGEVRTPADLTVQFKLSGRERAVKFDGIGAQRLTPGTREKVAEALASGDKDAAVKALVDGVQDSFYRSLFQNAIGGEDGDSVDEYFDGFA